MKRKISLVIVLMLTLSALLPTTTVFGYDIPRQKGYVTSGLEYEGNLDKNSEGNSIPVEYTLLVEQNSMVRFQAYTTSSNFSLEIDSPDNPNIAPGIYSVIKGNACTVVNDFNINETETYKTDGITVKSDKQNTKPYTEVFTNLIAGTYKVRISGGPAYKFKTIIAPVIFQDDSDTLSNFTRDTGIRIALNQAVTGNMMSNGIRNGKYYDYDNDKVSNDFYKFYIDRPGYYKVTFISDGFFQGVGEVIDQNGKFVANGTMNIGLSFNGGRSKSVIGTFEQHKAAEGTSFFTEFEAKETGMFCFQVLKKDYTAGSYQFTINTTVPGSSTTNPTGTPTPTPYNINDAKSALESVNITPVEARLSINETRALTLNGVFSNGISKNVTNLAKWSSVDSNIISVDQAGILKGVGAGTTTVKALLEGKTAEIKVSVTLGMSEIQVKKLIPAKTKMYMKVGKTSTNVITAVLADGTKKVMSGEVSLSSSGKAVIIKDKSILKAVKKGTVKITAKYGNVTTSYTVVVK